MSEQKNWNEIERPIRLTDTFEVIGHAAAEGATLGENGKYVLRRSNGDQFLVQAVDHPLMWSA